MSKVPTLRSRRQRKRCSELGGAGRGPAVSVGTVIGSLAYYAKPQVVLDPFQDVGRVILDDRVDDDGEVGVKKKAT